MTLLLLPQCHAAFSTIPSTLDWVDQSPVCQRVFLNLYIMSPPAPPPPHTHTPVTASDETQGTDLHVTPRYGGGGWIYGRLIWTTFFLLLNKLIKICLYSIVFIVNVQTSFTPIMLRIYSASVNATYSRAYSVAKLRAATLEVALRFFLLMYITTHGSENVHHVGSSYLCISRRTVKKMCIMLVLLMYITTHGSENVHHVGSSYLCISRRTVKKMCIMLVLLTYVYHDARLRKCASCWFLLTYVTTHGSENIKSVFELTYVTDCAGSNITGLRVCLVSKCSQ
jgi:hypothetical protein